MSDETKRAFVLTNVEQVVYCLTYNYPILETEHTLSPHRIAGGVDQLIKKGQWDKVYRVVDAVLDGPITYAAYEVVKQIIASTAQLIHDPYNFNIGGAHRANILESQEHRVALANAIGVATVLHLFDTQDNPYVPMVRLLTHPDPIIQQFVVAYMTDTSERTMKPIPKDIAVRTVSLENQLSRANEKPVLRMGGLFDLVNTGITSHHTIGIQLTALRLKELHERNGLRASLLR